MYYESGWVGERLQRNIMNNGFSVSSEFANSMVRNNTWSHWAVDEKYGGSTLKGWNSEILRFAQNTQRDIWNPDPRLGTQHIIEWQGWTGQNDYNKFMKNVWDNNVPVKFLQQQEIKTWTPEAITLENNLSVTGTSLENRIITQKGVKVLEGHNYLLPWSSEMVEFGETASNDTNKQSKLYNYSLAGGAQTWTLLPEFANQTTLKLYELTDQGRKFVSDVTVTGGKVNLNPKENTAYVLVPTTALATTPAISASDTVIPNASTNWGYGIGVNDPGFNSGTLAAWNPQGNVTLRPFRQGPDLRPPGRRCRQHQPDTRRASPRAPTPSAPGLKLIPPWPARKSSRAASVRPRSAPRFPAPPPSPTRSTPPACSTRLPATKRTAPSPSA